MQTRLKAKMLPTVMACFLMLSISYTQNETRKKGKYPTMKISQGALVHLNGAIQRGAVVQIERRAVVVSQFGQVASGNGQMFAGWRRFDLGCVREKR